MNGSNLDNNDNPPILYFLLEHNKFQQLTQICMNRTLATKTLVEYGAQLEGFDEREEFKIGKSVNTFGIEQVPIFKNRQQLITLKGSHRHNPKNY